MSKKLGWALGLAILLTGCGGGQQPVADAIEVQPHTIDLETATPEPMSTDDIYIATLDVAGIYYSTEEAAIAAGHAICNGFDAGLSLVQVGLTAVREGGYTVDEAGTIIGVAVGAYCPEHEGVFEG